MLDMFVQCRGTLRGVLLGAAGAALLAVAFDRPPRAVASEPPNAVQREMRLLEVAMQAAVVAIGRGDVRGLPRKLHAAHVGGGDTKKALRDGSYKLPRAPDQVDAFIALDKQFHAELIKMAKAARKNDVATTARQLGVLMNRCGGCHDAFRGPVRK